MLYARYAYPMIASILRHRYGLACPCTNSMYLGSLDIEVGMAEDETEI